MNNLLENYLEPLKRETFLSNAEINALFGNIQEIVTFQRQFLQNLDHAIEIEADFNNFEHPSQFKVGGEFFFVFKIIHSFQASDFNFSLFFDYLKKKCNSFRLISTFLSRLFWKDYKKKKQNKNKENKQKKGKFSQKISNFFLHFTKFIIIFINNCNIIDFYIFYSFFVDWID